MDNMKKLIEEFPEQLRHALKIGKDAGLQAAPLEIKHVVIAGVGGSGIGGSIVHTVIQDELQVPLLVSKSYSIPAFVNQHTLFIASSFSGETEETLASLQKARQAGAQCVLISSGGRMVGLAEEQQLELIKIPGSSKSPRASIGYSIVEMLFVLHKKGLISNSFIKQTELAANTLQQEADTLRSRGEKLANTMKGYLPFIYAGSRLYPIATRIQQQINKNGKHLCHINEVPEMNHNELVGWEHPEQVMNDSKVYFLHSAYDDPRIREHCRISREILQKKAANVSSIEAQGESLLEECLNLIHLTDWVSYYLALANEADPNDTAAIDHLKKEFSKKL